MAGVYLSYPFCSQKCTFCNFASGVSTQSEQERYTDSLTRELARQVWPWKPETVYWGGGTPSLMPLDEFASIMNLIPSDLLEEVTLEAAPGTIASESARAWRRCGVNRVSLGVQSLVTEEARRTGRKHTPETVVHDLKILADAGITNVNLDLIAGLPGQTFDSWRKSLDRLARLEPAHASVYLFEMDEESRLGREALLGGVRYGAGLLPNNEAMAEFYEIAVEHLGSCGLRRYEISNFARPGYESRHNLKYWRLEPYLGFGVDAHSFDGSTRWSNPDNVEEYIECILSGRSAALDASPTDPQEEHFFVGLRQTDGIRPSPAEWLRFNGAIERGIRAGVLERDDSVLRLTSRGFLLSNEIFQEFIS
jgi:oxygen-independent coproporphyrinogen III oxidase